MTYGNHGSSLRDLPRLRTFGMTLEQDLLVAREYLAIERERLPGLALEHQERRRLHRVRSPSRPRAKPCVSAGIATQ